MPDPEATPPKPATAKGPPADTPAEAQGRKALSTAFVRLGPDGHVTVDLRDGRIIVLNNVQMGPKDYCGVHTSGDKSGTKFCGAYGDIVAARPGGGPDQQGPAGPNTAEPARGTPKGG